MPVVRLSDARRNSSTNIVSSQINDGAIVTSKLLVTSRGIALNDDPGMMDASAWTVTGAPIFTTINDGVFGKNVVRSGPGTTTLISRPFAVNQAKTYRIRVKLNPRTGNGLLYLAVLLQDASGANIARDADYWYYPVSGVVPDAGWKEYTGIFGAGQGGNVFPVVTRTMAVGLVFNQNGSSGFQEAQDLRIEEMVSTDLVVDGSIGAIKINSNGLSIKDKAGHVILEAGDDLASSTFSGNTVGSLNGVAVSTVVTNASSALTAATAAQTAAAAANTALANIASDSILSPSEKPSVVRDYNVITLEQGGIDAQATAYNITTEKTAYDASINTLTVYLATLTGWNVVPGSDVAVVGATFRTNFANVYTAKQTLLNKIAAVAGTIANWATVTGTGKPADNATVGATWGTNVTGSAAVDAAIAAAQTAASTASIAASAAAASAANATTAIANIASDSVVTAGEKPPILKEYNVLVLELAGIDAQASAYGITTERTAYTAATTALISYMNSLTGIFTVPGVDIDIVGTTFRTKFSDVYLAKQTLLNKISAVAGTLATWSTVTGAGKPADNATVGAIWGTNVTGSAAVDTAIAAAQATANTAQTAATNAQTSATTANTALANIASDAILSPSEKPSVVRDYTVITGEQGGIDAQATAYGITTEKTAYDAAITALTTYLGTLTGWNTVPGTDVAIVGTTFRTKFSDVYTARQTLLNKISAVAGTLATWASVTGAGKPADNATVGAIWGTNVVGSSTVDAAITVAQAAATAAQTSATAANVALTNIASDSILSPSEKPSVVQDYSVITGEQVGIDAQAVAYGVTTEKTAYDTAITTLTTYLGTLTGWNVVPGTDVTIVGTTFRTNFANVYTARQTLLTKIAAIAGTLATWSTVTGTGKPADNATVGAIWGTNVTGSAAVDAAITAATTAAATAQTAATAAQTSATAANTTLTNIASDAILSPGEKSAVVKEYSVITGEQAGIDAQATTYGITTEKTAYDGAVTALTTYLGTLTGWNVLPGSNVTIVGATFRTKFSDVYTTKQALLNRISAVAGTLATWATVSGVGKPADNATVGAIWGTNVTGSAAVDASIAAAQSAATTAQAAATAAQTTATAAQTALTNIASDSILSPSEKPSVVQDYNSIIGEQAGIDAQASAYGITTERTTYDGAITALTTYLNTLTGWNIVPGSDVAIVGTTFRSNFTAVYTAKQALLNKIAAVSGTLANWATITGTGKPADNATVGATWGTNVVGSAAVDTAIAAASAAATTAQAAASTAQTAANTANTALASIASDSVLSSGEKSAVVIDYNAIIGEQAGIDSQATAYGITTEKTTYDNAVTALTTYLGTLTGWNVIPGSNVTIVGTTFRSNFTAVYTAKQALLNKIAAVAGTLATWSAVTGVGRPADNATVGATWGTNVVGSAAVDASIAAAASAAATAQTAATNAQTTANAFNATLTNIASDNILSAGEKPTVVQDYNVITGEQAGIDAQAVAYAITTEKTAYDSAITSLTTYLGTLTGWNTLPGTDVTIVGTTFRTNFANVYTAKQTLLNKIASIAGTMATWANVTGSAAVDASIVAAQTAATAAQAAATAAQTSANTANTALTNIASDSFLSPSEKPSVVQDYTVITGEQAGIDAQATAYAITTEKTAYDTAITALTTYLGTLTGWNTVPGVDVAIVGTTFRTKFSDVYTAKQVLMNKITAVAGTVANWATVNGAAAVNTAITAAQTAATAAQTTANTANTTANAAQATLTNIASDSILSAVEKVSVVRDYAVITGEQAGIDAQATSYAITTEKTAYDSAISTLTTYLGTLTGWNVIPGSDVTIVGTTFRTNFTNVYTTRQTLLNKISAIAGTIANWATVSGSTAVDASIAAAQSAATAAQTTATAAQTSATAANTALTNIASDSILSPSEKPSVVQNYTVLTGEQAGIDAQAVAYGITTEKTAYDTAITTLTTYLGTLTGWNTVPGSDVTIVGTTFRSNFAAVYTAKQTLLNKIASVAGTLASWTTVTGAGKPADNATSGITLNTDPYFADKAKWGGTTNSYTWVTGLTDGQAGTTSVRSTLAGAGTAITSNYQAVDPNRVYRARIWVRKSATADGTFFAGVSLLDTAGALIAGSGTYWYYFVSAGVPNVAWTEYVAIFGRGQTHPIPTPARMMGLVTLLGYTGTTVGYHEAQGFKLEDITESYDALVAAQTAQTAATAAQTAATNAQTAATTANTALANIASDSFLTAGEKSTVVQDYAIITSEQAGVDTQATAYGITTEKTAYDAAVTALTTYLGTIPGWNTIPGTDVAIVGTTFRSNFANVYTAKQTLLNKIAAVAGTLATWASINGTGKPADNATVGATIGTNLNGQITAGNASTFIANAAIQAAHIGSVNADTITVGALRGVNVNAGSHTTKGSYLTVASNVGDTTLFVKDTTDFSLVTGQLGGYFIDTVSDIAQFTYTGKTATTLTGVSGATAHTAGSTVVPYAKSVTVDSRTNEIRIFGDSGNSQTLQLASFGVNSSTDNILQIGDASSIHKAIYASSMNGLYTVGVDSFGNGHAIQCTGGSGGSSGIKAQSYAGAAVFGNCLAAGDGVRGQSVSGVGGHFSGNATNGHVMLTPLAALPSTHDNNVLCWVYTAGGTVGARTSTPRLMHWDGAGWAYFQPAGYFVG